MEKLKDWKTTSFAVLIAAQQLFEQLGIEVPQDWKDYILLGGMALLLFSGDPKAKDFVKSKLEEMKNQKDAQNHFDSINENSDSPSPFVEDLGIKIHKQNKETNES